VVHYLIEKRFSLEWYIEGGRSRSGKLLPPRFGLLARVVESYRRGKAEDVILVPVSIAYEQIQDVGDYAAEQRGAPKRKESFGWFVRVVRSMRRRYGTIHISFGEPIELSKAVGRKSTSDPSDTRSRDLAVPKLAFEVAVRINHVTPITPTSLVTLALLGGGDRALALDEVCTVIKNLLEFVERRNLTMTRTYDLTSHEGVRAALESLAANGVVSSFTEGAEPVYRIGEEQQLAAAYYRNTVIHYFVSAAIAERALLRAAETGTVDPIAEFWDEAMRLRDLLKFEFFFEEKDRFRSELRRELSLHGADWEQSLKAGADATQKLLRRFRPFTAHRVLRPFLEAYRLTADHLECSDTDGEFDEQRFVDGCMGRGKQYLLQRSIQSAASVSQVLIRTALGLARNRELLAPGDGLTARRAGFAEEIRDVVRRIDAVEALAFSRRAGLIE